MAHGDFTMLLPQDETVYAFTRSLDDVELLVAANFSGATVRADLDVSGWTDAELLLGNVARDKGADSTPWDGTLEPWEARVLRRTRG